jgi:transcriptional regulator with XRE-family HTH domain
MEARRPNGEAIRALRTSQGMTQEKLARLSGVDVKTIYRAERGELAVRLETLQDLAAALEVPLARLAMVDPAADEESTATAPESYRSLVLRRVDRAADYCELAAQCDRYVYRVKLDPDDGTAARLREFLELTRRAVLGAAAARDRFDADGEFSEPGRIARLKTLLDELQRAGVSVLANRFVENEPGAPAPRVVLHVLFADGDVRRAALAPRGVTVLDAHARIIEGVRALSFDTHMNSVMGALELALETLGDDVTYAFLMGASGAAFRLQIAHPEWCPSAPYAGVGFDCIPHAAAALGRPLEWLGPDDERRTAAIVASIDRGAPVLYGAEECGLIVGYHDGGRQLSLRTYFDAGASYALLERPSWARAGVLGEPTRIPPRAEILHGSLLRAVELADTARTFPTHRSGHVYLCGFAAWREWIAGLRDTARHAERERRATVIALRANQWCYRSLIDARSAASAYLRDFARETAPDVSAELERAAAAYDELAQRLRGGLEHVPGVAGDPDAWSDGVRRAQAEVLEAAEELERGAVDALRAALARG